MNRWARAWAAAYFLAAAGTASAATFTVTKTADTNDGVCDADCSLREAVVAANAAAGADTIDFAVTGTIVLTSGPLQIEQALTIVGPGSGRLTIDGNSNGRIFTILQAGFTTCPVALEGDYPVTISGLTLRNGRRSVADSSGGAIFSAKSLTLDDVTVRNSTAKSGGGLSFLVQHPGQALNIANSRFIDNVAQEVVAGNTGTINGGAVLVSELCGSARTMPVTVNISGSRFSGNASRPTTLGGRGGGLATFSDADITITGTRIVGNAVVSPAAPVGGTSFIGGGVYGRARSLTIERSEIAGNSADQASALGAYNDVEDLQTPAEAMSVKLVNTTVASNRAFTTIALYGYGNVAFDIANSTVAGNEAAPTRTGGFGFNTGATVPASAANALPPSLKLSSTILWNPGQSGDLLDIAKNNTNIPGTLNVDATQSLVGTICGAQCGTINLVGSGNKIGENPLLEPLAFNGGPTRTSKPRPSSASPRGSPARAAARTQFPQRMHFSGSKSTSGCPRTIRRRLRSRPAWRR
jgi:CSLREA domain-containing protein